jgi:hypothetical protein
MDSSRQCGLLHRHQCYHPGSQRNPLPSASTPLPDNQSGSATIPGGFTASAEQASYDSGDEFNYEGKANGAMYGSANPNASSAYSDPSCPHVSVVPGPSPNRSPTYNMGGIPNTASVMNMWGPIS